jgi:hypothetical protein
VDVLGRLLLLFRTLLALLLLWSLAVEKVMYGEVLLSSNTFHRTFGWCRQKSILVACDWSRESAVGGWCTPRRTLHVRDGENYLV